MKKIFFILILFRLNIGFAQYTSIPDPYFEQELINQGIDTDSTVNGQVLTSDVNTLTTLVLGSSTAYHIISLSGIENFTSLLSLDLGNTHSLTNLNLNNPQLQSLYIVFCHSLTSVNISGLSQLKLLYIDYSVIPNTINLTENVNLETLSIIDTQLTYIDLSNNINLKNLYLGSNNLSNIDVSNNINLINLGVAYNEISNINLTNNLLLETVGLNYCSLQSIDMSQNLLLKWFSCSHNNMTSIDLTSNVLLERLSCDNNNINTLNLNNSPLINILECSNNNLQSLQLQNGNNNLLNGTYNVNIFTYDRFNATNNPNLHCIFVDDIANCNANWLGVDATSHFVASQTECDALSNEEFSTNEISVYPNPVKDILYINNQNETIEEIVVYDLLGKIVIEQNNNKSQINLSELISGFYVVKIKTEKGYICKKVVKE